MPAAISATSHWPPLIPGVDAFEIVAYLPIVPWFVCRDDHGYWCVQRHGAWSCVVRLTGATSLPDDRLEEHAREVADALNRAYARS